MNELFIGKLHVHDICCNIIIKLCATAGTAIACLSHRNSVRLSVTRVDQSKMITKCSPLAAWKTLLSETVKLLHKFEGARPEQKR